MSARYWLPIAAVVSICLAGQHADRVLDARQSLPPGPSVNIEADIREYYASLDAARDQVVRNHPLKWDNAGNVVKDSAYNDARAEYDRLKRQAGERLATAGERRMAASEAFLQKTGMSLHGKEITYTGSPPGAKAFNPVHSDIEGILPSTAHVNRVFEMADRMGLKPERGPGYVRIGPYNKMFWDPNYVTLHQYQRTDPVTGVTTTEDVILKKRTSATESLVRIHDVEVVEGTEGGKPGVAQQIKKAEKLFRGAVPTGTQAQAELIQNVGKAGSKTLKTVDSGGPAGPGSSPQLVNPQTRELLDGLKTRQITIDDLANPLDRPATRQKKVDAVRTTVEGIFREALPIDRMQRDQEVKATNQRRVALENELQTTVKTADVKQAASVRRQLRETEQKLRVLHEQQVAEDLTTRIIEKKNPRLRDSVIRPQTGQQPPKGLTVKSALGMSMVGRGMGIHQAYTQEVEAAKHENRDFSQAKMAVNIVKNLSGITLAVSSAEGFAHETGAGMEDYVRREIDRYAAEGYDVASNPGLQTVIHRRAVARATVRATWQGSKALPVVGNVVAGIEDTYNLAESTIGVAYDTYQGEKLREINRVEQAGQMDRAATMAAEMRDVLLRQKGAAETDAALAAQIAAAIDELTAVTDALDERIRAEFQALETIAERREEAGQPAGAAAPVAEETIQRVTAVVAAVTRTARTFSRDCETAINNFKNKKIAREDLQERQGAFRRRLMDLDAEYFRASSLVEQANADLQALVDARDAQQIQQFLVRDLDTVNASIESLETLARAMEKVTGRYQDIVRCFTAQQQQLKRLCDYFAQRPGGDETQAAKLRRIRGEITGYRVEARLPESYLTRPADLRLLQSRLKLLTKIKLPAVPELSAPVPAAGGDQLARAAADMDLAIETARERFRQLRELAPLEPPLFQLVVKPLTGNAYEFSVAGDRIPAGTTLSYAWDFGDGGKATSANATQTHRYAEVRPYTIEVQVLEVLPRGDNVLARLTAAIGQGAIDCTKLALQHQDLPKSLQAHVPRAPLVVRDENRRQLEAEVDRNPAAYRNAILIEDVRKEIARELGVELNPACAVRSSFIRRIRISHTYTFNDKTESEEVEAKVETCTATLMVFPDEQSAVRGYAAAARLTEMWNPSPQAKWQDAPGDQAAVWVVREPVEEVPNARRGGLVGVVRVRQAVGIVMIRGWYEGVPQKTGDPNTVAGEYIALEPRSAPDFGPAVFKNWVARLMKELPAAESGSSARP